MDCELNEKLQYCIEQTAKYIDATDRTWEEMPIRNILTQISEIVPGYKNDIELVEQKIREANLILSELKQFFEIFNP